MKPSMLVLSDPSCRATFSRSVYTIILLFSVHSRGFSDTPDCKSGLCETRASQLATSTQLLLQVKRSVDAESSFGSIDWGVGDNISKTGSSINQTGESNHIRHDDSEAVLVYWTHGPTIQDSPRIDNSGVCGFPCVQAAYPDPAAFDMADVLLSFPIDPTPPKNARGGVSIAFTQESKRLYGAEDANAYDAFAALDWRSTIPWTLFDPINFAMHHKTVVEKTPTWEERKPAAVFVARNCKDKGRLDFIAELVERDIKVESISDCKPANTTGEWPSDVPRESKIAALGKYRVYFAFENVEEEGYVTEKLHDGLESGAVTVYLGAPDIDHYVPNNGFINANGWESNIDSIADQIKEVIEDKGAWSRHREWMDEDPQQWNDGKILEAFAWSSGNATVDTPICRICSFGFAKRMGKSWNQQKQRSIGIDIPPNGDRFWKTWPEQPPPNF